jgi:hypothetical protein
MYNLRKVYTGVYQNGYVHTIHGTYEYMQVYCRIGFRTFILVYNAVQHGTSLRLFIQVTVKYEIVPFKNIRVHESTSVVYFFCSPLLQHPGSAGSLESC